MWELNGRTALVTGGAKRLGRAIAQALAGAGMNVALHYNTSAVDADELCHALEARGVRAWGLQADLAIPDEAEALLPRAITATGGLDVLINSASIFPASTLHSVTAAQLQENVHLHAFAPLALTRGLVSQGREGVVINMLDTRVQDYDREHAAYHLSKRMLLALTSMCALEFAPLIRVNGVAPGLILPPVDCGYDHLERLASTNPLNTYGSVEDITSAVLFLVGSPFVTGQVLYVDGGRHLKGRVYD